jgi:hypothetical protein
MSEQKIVLGTTTRPASRGPRPLGYELGSNGSTDDQPLDRRKTQEPAVRPAVLIATLAVMLVGIVALVAKVASGPQVATDVDKVAADFRDYLTTRGTAGPVPGTVEDVRRQLREAVYLEDAGRTTEARRVWASLLIACGTASPTQSMAGNPVCDAAAARLRALK